MAAQDTGKFRENTKDQFYTQKGVAAHCVQRILELLPWAAAGAAWIEPSAGKGVFLEAAAAAGITTALGLDIDPKAEGIQKADFLEWNGQPAGEHPPLGGASLALPEGALGETAQLIFGNPPFGRQGSAAKAFIKHAAGFAATKAIAFILPRSFVKPSMSRAFPPRFHCLWSEELAANSFEVNGEPYDVPCVFQIWERREVDRPVVAAPTEKGFSYVKSGEACHIVFRRVGGTAGSCVAFDATASYNKQVYYFLRLDTAFQPHVKKIVDAVNAHVFPSNTVGPRSLSKGEATEVLNEVIESISAPQA